MSEPYADYLDLIEATARALASDDAKSKTTDDGTPLVDLVWKVSIPDAVKAINVMFERFPDLQERVLCDLPCAGAPTRRANPDGIHPTIERSLMRH